MHVQRGKATTTTKINYTHIRFWSRSRSVMTIKKEGDEREHYWNYYKNDRLLGRAASCCCCVHLSNNEIIYYRLVGHLDPSTHVSTFASQLVTMCNENAKREKEHFVSDKANANRVKNAAPLLGSQIELNTGRTHRSQIWVEKSQWFVRFRYLFISTSTPTKANIVWMLASVQFHKQRVFMKKKPSKEHPNSHLFSWSFDLIRLR